MGYLRSLFLTLTIAVQLVTLAYVLVVMGNSQPYDGDRSIVNATDARAVYYLAAVAMLMTLGTAVLLWRERRGRSRRAAAVTPVAESAPVRSSRRSRRDGGSDRTSRPGSADLSTGRDDGDRAGKAVAGGDGGDGDNRSS